MIRALPVDPATVVTELAAAVSADQRYLDPTDEERNRAALGLARVLVGNRSGAVDLLAPLGFSVESGVDGATGRPFVLAVSGPDHDRPWGLFLVDVSTPPRLCVAVPHPKFDLRCEQLALRLWRAVPGALLAMATVHRDAALGVADHAHNAQTVFHALWTGVLGPWGVPQVQIHGFADNSAPEQVAVSTGAGPQTPTATRIADGIAATDLRTTRSWDGSAHPNVRAMTNQQGIAAAANGWSWVHIEHNRFVRDRPAKWQPEIDAVAAADPGLP